MWGASHAAGHVVPRCGTASLGLQDRPEAAVTLREDANDQRLGAYPAGAKLQSEFADGLQVARLGGFNHS